MEADFDRYYARDLGEVIWVLGWPPSKVAARIRALPEESAYRLARSGGWTTKHELLAAIHDRVTTTAHGWRLEGKPQPWPRPGGVAPDPEEGLDPTNPENANALIRFFGRPR